ncbi:MAG: ATP-binding protein [Bacteroidota bacterium]|nr:ATP-binding protein [Bacteroidota bacterium]
METPFIYGKLATGNNFTDREDEQERLIRNFLSGANTILISPRRWGKSSLVLKSAEKAKSLEKSTIVVFIDLFNIRNEEEFYKVLAEKVIQSVSTKMEEVILNVKEFMKQWIPKISFSPDSQQEFNLGLNWNELKKNPDEILDLAEKIAISKNLKIVICVDEFQNIAYYDNPLAFQKYLRAHWQQHQSITYCLYGSKKHMLMEVFTSPSMPFYKFGDLIFLSKIDSAYWKLFITERFRSTGKEINPEQAGRIAALVDCHPYYVQQLAQLVWLRTEKSVNNTIIEKAIDSLTLQLSMLFQNMTESLSTTQVNFLKMILDKVIRLSSKENIENYKIGTSANIVRIKKALNNKEIIDEQPDEIKILDPLYALWLKKYYFIGHRKFDPLGRIY